jgi:acyl-CoA synthetase (AMP-forming)/AMP-acid ligase II
MVLDFAHCIVDYPARPVRGQVLRTGAEHAMKITDLLANSVARSPDRVCVIAGDRTLTFAQVDSRAGRLAQAFAATGVRRGDRVALLARSEPEYFELQVAAQRAGAILVPLNFRLALRELSIILEDCKPALLIHGPGYADLAAELDVPQTWGFGPGHVGEDYEALLSAFDARETRELLEADAPSAILYTSGTTGRPKGAVTSNGTLWARINFFALETGMEPGDTFLFPIPLFHVSSAVAYAFAYRGGTVVLMRDFDAPEAARLMAAHRVTHAVFVPTMIGRIVEELAARPAKLDALRLVLYGGSAIAPDVLRRAMRVLGCRFLQGYGLTEAINATMLRPVDHDPERWPERLASAGTGTTSYDIQVVDAEDQELAPGEIGEIVIRGPGVMDGYWAAPEATAKVLRGGWLHTGDLGYRAHDGYLYITDRLKDVIVSGGENVYSREVEDALYEHADVLEAAVVGIPSRRWGESVHAEVVPRSGATLDADDLIAHCRERLATYKAPKSVLVVDELPKNASGKILKRVVRERYWAGAERAVG